MPFSEKTNTFIRHLDQNRALQAVDNALSYLVNKISLGIAPRIIGFCGAAGAGKDTASFLLTLLGYQKIAFADALKIEAYDLCVNPTDEYRLRVQVELGITLPLSLDQASSEQEKIDIINRRKVELRRLLQWHGTEFRRAQDPNYWLNLVRDKMATGRWVVSDMRFQNEVNMVRSIGGVIWLIQGRDDGYTPTHASETDWRGTSFDCTFDNSTSIDKLQEQLYEKIFEDAVCKCKTFCDAEVCV